MAQFPILSGLYTDTAGDLRTAMPVNMVPVPKSNGISEGYLRPADGIERTGTGPGADRGGINWNGKLYRVMGSSLLLVSANGSMTELGIIAGTGQVTMDYSFDRLAIIGGGRLHYYDGTSVTQVIDPDLGYVTDGLWVDGYFMLTDGVSLIVTELTDPTSVNPLKYGSSEIDPDPVKGLFKLHNEVHALNRYTVEVFNNVGGRLFPFARNESAQMQRGALGTFTATNYTSGNTEVIAFLGSGRNEAPSVWIGVNGSTAKIATREIDTLLQSYTEEQLARVIMESRLDKAHHLLYLHLPDRTLVYDSAASAAVEEPVWFVLTSSITGFATYRARNLVWCYDGWQVADPFSTNTGRLTSATSSHYGEPVGWEFNTSIIYNSGRGALFHQLELVTLPGRVPLGADPVVWSSYSLDGVKWSMERSCKAGQRGAYNQRLTWLRDGAMQNWRIQRFRGTSDAHLSCVRLEVQLEALAT